MNVKSQISINKENSVILRDKSKRRKKRRQTILSLHDIESTPSQSNDFDILGLKKLPLSQLTQKIVGCVVGFDVTAEEPWIMISKDKLLDNIELHEDSSEFLPIAKDIEVYPEAEILVGWIVAGSINDDYFYIAYTLEAKEKVLNVVAEENAKIKDKLQRCIRRPIRRWRSLGSEKEINLSLIQNFRPLIQIEIKCRHPLMSQMVHFKLRRVEDARDGYVEFLPDARYPITTVEKKRVDISVQVASRTISCESQTTLVYPKNMYTQYNFVKDLEEFKAKKLQKPVKKGIEPRQIPEFKFEPKNIDLFIEWLHFNSYVNLYSDDYTPLCIGAKRYKYDSSARLHRLLSLSYTKATGHNVACDSSWYNFKTGLIAICYAEYAFSAISSGRHETNEAAKAVEGACPVLLWSYDDGLYPKLFLQTPREVTYISFCPHKENILVGGCKNGQIVVWDIANKLEEVEARNVLTYKQRRNRLNIWQIMDWMKNTYNIAEVEPVLVSSLRNSHRDMVTNLKWIHPNMELNVNGRWRSRAGEEETLAFMSLSLDGTICVWDLNIVRPHEIHQDLSRKSREIDNVPSGLPDLRPELKKHHAVFKPYFKIIVKEDNEAVPILAVVKRTNMLKYSKIAYSSNSIRTAYVLDKDQSQPEISPFFVTTTTGKIFKLSWNGFDYILGPNINIEEAALVSYQTIHDGPITCCHYHPYFGEYLMTIGGQVFAIWHVGSKRALFWRKAANRTKYMSGMWVCEISSCLSIVRSDGAFEIWDFLYSTVLPLRTLYLGGDLITNISGGLSSVHSRHSTFAVTDNLGSCTVFRLPNFFMRSTKNHIKGTEKLLLTIEERNRKLLEWMDQYEEEFYEEKSKATINLVENVAHSKHGLKLVLMKHTVVDKMNKIFDEVTWDKNTLEMYKTLLSRKHLNLAELNQIRPVLQRREEESQSLGIKIGDYLSQKPSFFASASHDLLNEELGMQNPVYTTKNIKEEDYIEGYDAVEQSMLGYIASHGFVDRFSFAQLIDSTRRERRRIRRVLRQSNVRNDRER